ncbi:unnamed protein product [Eruca vesicaria subsp. sativa]|uniref:J domain-containing protein n=1 Tax=Eruca vesicaria subsp. sativa TaxID=29727 RepID=A0ABC8KGM3_ERUVS|nr:unnamed protein product [Eruca vesicaria subsp. sativa]
MDYNKEEADRARGAAVDKFLAKDYAGAKKFALKAQSLNPEIVGIKEMVATFVMHLAAQHTINGVIDYYGVLGVKPEADDETVKKRYLKLSEMLNPNRNNSIGGEEAFMFVSQAWDALSDKEKRADYDKKRNNEASPTEQTNNGVQISAKGKTPKRGMKRAIDASASSSSTAPPAAPTISRNFWTVCSTCKTRFEYSRVYLNQYLRCPPCGQPFTAVETDPPHSSAIRETFIEHQVDSILHLTDGREKGIDNMVVDSTEWGGVYTGTINADQAWPREDEAVRIGYTEMAAGTPSTNPPKRRKVMENEVAGSSFAPNSVGEFSEEELTNVMVKKKSKPTIVTRLQDLIDTASGTDKDMTIKVPESDFCDFDKNRTEKSFSDNQIWATYYPSEGKMPRVYFRVDKVLSVEPFKLCITRLDASETNRSSELLGFGVGRTCGGFIDGGHGASNICDSLKFFSHKVEVTKGNNEGEVLIYPRTGDVWAMYKNWSRYCNYLEGDKEVAYDVVEVVEGYTEEYGVLVVPLMKVAGFKSVFRHYLDSTEVIPKDELSRFSHQIPSHLLTGKEAGYELRGCRVLDPAATPPQLRHVING